jgi:outer membrane receptor protein involved in Fe transport
VTTHGASVQAAWSVTGHDFITAGVDYFAENDDTWRIADVQIVNAANEVRLDPPADLVPPTPLSSRRGLAAYAENEWNLVLPVTLNTGLRADFIQSQAEGTPGTLTPADCIEKDHDLSGNLGTVIRLSPDLRLTLNAGRAFKAPALQERFFRGTGQTGFVEGNPDLKSENSLNFDLGIRLKNGPVRMDLNVFRNRIWDFIVLKPVSAAADTFLYDNVGDALLFGAEFEGQWTLSGSWILFGSAATVRGRDIGKYEDLPKIPPLDLKTGLKFDDPRGFWMGVSADFVSRQNHTAPNEQSTRGYALLHWNSGADLHSLLHISQHIVITFNVHNVLNTKYQDHLSNITWCSAPGRNITLNLNWNF